MTLRSGELELSIEGFGSDRRLKVIAPLASDLSGFEGSAGESSLGIILQGPLSAMNALAVRLTIPWLNPRPIGLHTSAGVGDRLGLATSGQARAFKGFGQGIVPVFAQQSMREMNRLGRSPQNVLDDATFGCVQAGWESPVGADADHLKTTHEIDRCLEAGFTSFTLDPGEYVRAVSETVSDRELQGLPWADLDDDLSTMTKRYQELDLDIEGGPIVIDEFDIRRAAFKYGSAVAYTVALYRHLMHAAKYPVEVEVAVDETDEPTTLAEHIYMATEMRRLGMEWVSFAPRYVGGFEKGVDYIGDTGIFSSSMTRHAQIARALGPYKLSLHSGSDKFSIYELASSAIGPLVHLKTSGTSYLEALGIAAKFAPTLFREIYAVSREAYKGARASYQVSARIENTPDPFKVPEEELLSLVTSSDSRQILHVGYGAALTLLDGDGDRALAGGLRSVLESHSIDFEMALETHLGRHLRPFAGRVT